MDIRGIIKRKGFTLTYVADRLTNKKGGKGVSLPSLIQTIDGNPTVASLQEIASIIGVTLAELVSEADCSDFIALIKQGGELYSASSIAEARVVLDKLENKKEGI